MGGIRKYGRVLSFAHRKQIALDLAEVHEQALLGQNTALTQLKDARNARAEANKQQLLITQLHMSADEARAVLQEARAGDDAAWAKIKLARQLRANGRPEVKMK